MKSKNKISTKLEFLFDVDDVVIPDLDFELPKTNVKTSNINIISIKKQKRDVSTNSQLF